MPTRFERFLCWFLFTVAMTVLGWVLRWIVPPAVRWIDGIAGPGTFLVAFGIALLPVAYSSYREPLLAALARRRRRIGQGQQP